MSYKILYYYQISLKHRGILLFLLKFLMFSMKWARLDKLKIGQQRIRQQGNEKDVDKTAIIIKI